MPHSMTGFSTAEETVPPFRLVWEIRSVNHRFLELSFRIPDELRALEPECRSLIGAAVSRGKVDCTLKIVAADAGAERGALVAETLQAVKALESEVRAVFPGALALTVGEILRWPGVMKGPEQRVAALGSPAVLRCLGAALEGFGGARRREGERIAELLEKRVLAIAALLDSVRPLLAGAQSRYRDKLRERLARLDVQAEPERLEQELALIAQRVDVSEEVDRLDGHVTEIRATLARAEPVGRRLDFLIQELNREANTFASKVQDETLTRTAVELKVLIEQMREQVQNLE
jgi:uncharacterized protein (TIGR00255 family)